MRGLRKSKVADLVSLRKRVESSLKMKPHANICKLLDAYEDDKWVYLVYEFCAGGSLLSLLATKKSITEKQVSQIMRQVFEALKFAQ